MLCADAGPCGPRPKGCGEALGPVASPGAVEPQELEPDEALPRLQEASSRGTATRCRQTPWMRFVLLGTHHHRRAARRFIHDRGARFTPSTGSPKLDEAVERGNRTQTVECSGLTEAAPEPAAFQVAPRTWEIAYTTIRPYQTLGYLAPAEYPHSLGVEP